MTDQVMLAVASAVAGKAAEAATAGGKTALAALVRLIRNHLHNDSAAARALEPPPGASVDQRSVQELARALEQAATVDLDFAARVRALWPQAQAEISAHGSGTVNISTGTVGGHLIQARDLDVHGGLYLGGPPAP